MVLATAIGCGSRGPLDFEPLGDASVTAVAVDAAVSADAGVDAAAPPDPIQELVGCATCVAQ